MFKVWNVILVLLSIRIIEIRNKKKGGGELGFRELRQGD